MPKIKTVQDVDLSGKKVFVRVDFNVPMSKDGKITDNTRIKAALPTIQHLVDQGAKVILASHLGRPKGQVNSQFSLKPVAAGLSDLINIPVQFVNNCIGEEAETAANSLQSGGILLLENLRFHAEEEKNDADFCAALAKLADAYVNDAFGTAHRAHASTAGIAALLPIKVAGLLVERELAFLGDKTNNPVKPLTVILGGAKVSDKIKVIDALLEKADSILIGGAMAYTFALAQGRKIGDSLSEPDKVSVAKEALEKAKAKGVNFLLPVDNLVVDSIDFDAGTVGNTQYAENNIPDGWEGVDIGPKTVELYKKELKSAKTILWNGPMGIFEIETCSKGTFAIAETIAKGDSISIIGGGDSVKAINQSGFSEDVTFMSTGGGASLEFLEGKELPGVAALETK